MLSKRVTIQTINEFNVAMPSFPALHAKAKFSKVGALGRANGAVKISEFVLNETLNTHTSGAR